MNKIKVAIAGLGGRGRDTFGRLILENPDIAEVVAVADINENKKNEAADVFNLPSRCCFNDVADLLNEDKLADVLFICTPDENHYKTAIRALSSGYHLLLEKPAAVKTEDCLDIAKTASEKNRHVVVCHSLRYTPFYGKIKEIIDSGDIGEVVTLDAFEGVGYYHHAHSFVRGNWSDTKQSSPMILAKCCHDMDIIIWLTNKHINAVSSFGCTQYFKPEKAPEGAAKRCLDCKFKNSCIYSAEEIYINSPKTGVKQGNTGWPADVLARPVTEENIRLALKTGPYGRCVFYSDNDTVDHQVVNIEFTDGASAHLTMTAFSDEIYRTVRVMGTLGIIEGDTRTNIIKMSVYGKEPVIIDIDEIVRGLGSHGGGDALMFAALMDLLSGKSNFAHSTIDKSVESHIACLAAEKSRQNGGESILLQV